MAKAKIDDQQLARQLGELIGEAEGAPPKPVVGKAPECETVEDMIRRNRAKGGEDYGHGS